jgi:hypothetical protein
MAKLAANQTRVFLDEFRISADLQSFDLSVEQERARVDDLESAGPERLVGNYDHKFGANGFFDGADNAFDERVRVDLNTDEDHYLAVIFGTTEGSPGYEQVVRLSEEVRSGGVGGAIMLNIQAEGSGRMARVKALRFATVTGAGNGTGQNLGATVSGQTLVATFRVISFSGTDITMKIQESSDDGAGDAYADVAGLTSGALSAAGVVRVTTTAATEAWKRVVVSGTITSMAILVTLGVSAGE